MAQMKKVQLKLLLVLLAAVLVFVACGVLLLVHFLGEKPADDIVVLYSKGGQQLYLQARGDVVALQARESKRQFFSDGGGGLYYDAVTEEGLALRFCDLTDASARKNGGVLVAENVEPFWAAEATGRYCVYQVGKRLLCYDAVEAESEEMTNGAETLYAGAGQPAVFFTKMEGIQRVLFRCVPGQPPERIAAGVAELYFYDGARDACVLYLMKTGENSVLASVGVRGAAREIAQNPAQVFFERYVPGGNLYYFANGAQTAGVGIILEDPQAAADAALTEPKREDYWNGLLTGYFGEQQYKAAQRAYSEKQERDALRANLRRLLQALPNGQARQTLFVDDGSAAHKLAEGVAADIVSMRAKGRPAVLYEKNMLVAQQDAQTVTLEEMLRLWRDGGEATVAEALGRLAGQVTQNAGVYLAQLTVSGASEVQFAAARMAGSECVFFPEGELLLYAEPEAVGGKQMLYAYGLTEYGVSERKLVDSSVTETLPALAGLYYQKQEPGVESKTLFYYDGTKSERLVPHVDASYFAQSEALLVVAGAVKNQQGALWLCRGAEGWKVADDAKVGSVHTAADRAYYIAGTKNGSGSLMLCVMGKTPVVLDTEITEIVAAY
jgi:hypothetical protein